MKKLLLLIFLFSFAGHSQSDDKLLHFGAGVVAGGAGAFIASEISGGDKWWSIAGAVGSSLIAGAAKEVIDKNRSGNWDNGDLAATVAGGITVGIAIEIFSGRKKRRTVRLFRGKEDSYVLRADPLNELLPDLN
jgi:hypothetical protein